MGLGEAAQAARPRGSVLEMSPHGNPSRAELSPSLGFAPPDLNRDRGKKMETQPGTWTSSNNSELLSDTGIYLLIYLFLLAKSILLLILLAAEATRWNCISEQN